MKTQCPSCNSVYRVNESKIPDKGAFITCKKCNKRFVVKKKDGISIKACPKCGYKNEQTAIECQQCGIIFKKYYAILERNKEKEEKNTADELKKPDITTTDPLTTEQKEVFIDSSIKMCPACSKEIKLEAIKCRYCGQDFNPDKVKKQLEEKEYAAKLYYGGIQSIKESKIINGVKLLKNSINLGNDRAKEYLADYITSLKKAHLKDKEKKCPFCAEIIEYMASECKYCHQKLILSKIDKEVAGIILKKDSTIMGHQLFEKGLNLIEKYQNDEGLRYIKKASEVGDKQALRYLQERPHLDFKFKIIKTDSIDMYNFSTDMYNFSTKEDVLNELINECGDPEPFSKEIFKEDQITKRTAPSWGNQKDQTENISESLIEYKGEWKVPDITIIYAGFWKRLAAYIIDALIMFVPMFIIGFIVSFFAISSAETELEIQAFSAGAQFITRIISVIVAWIYFAAMESSSKQGSLGKMALGIKVTDYNGEKISFGKASGRFFGKILSGIIVGIGFLMIAFTKKKQGLHDIIAGTLIVNQ